MHSYTFRQRDITKTDDMYNHVWDYRYIRYTLVDGTQIDIPYGCNCKPMLREYKNGSLVNFDDLSAVVIL